MISETQLMKAMGSLRREDLRMWVDAGWVQPKARSGRWAFREVDVARVRLILDMRDDLGVPPDSIPVVLSLIDQLHGVRHELRRLASAIAAEPDEVRRRICRKLENGN